MDDYLGHHAHPWQRTLAERWGHHGTELLVVSIAGAIVLGVHPLPGLLGLTTPLALIVFVLATFLLMRRHDRRLCEACATSMPLNAGEVAARYGNRFALAHAIGSPRVLLPYLAVLIGSNALLVEPLGGGLVTRVLWGVVQSSMVYLMLSYSTHRRLQPWCPRCSGGDGGHEHDEDPVTPDPVGGIRR